MTTMTAITTIDLFLRSADASWTQEKWERLPADGNRYEVIDGVLYMSTAPGFSHQRIIARLQRHIGIPLEDRGLAVAVDAPVGLIMPGTDPVQPDFMLIRRERMSIVGDDDRVHGVPDLIVEVLSPSNPELDTVIKRAAYARAGLPEYWIIRPGSRDVLVCSDPDPALADFTQVRHVRDSDELVSPTLPITVQVAALFDDPSPAAG